MRNKCSETQHYPSLLPGGFLVWISGKENPGWAWQSWEATAESGSWRWTEFPDWVCRKRELHRGKTLKIWRGSPLVFSRVVISTLQVKKLQSLGKNHARGLGEQCPHFHRAGLSACSHEADWSISWFTQHWMEHMQRNLASVVVSSSRWALLWSCLIHLKNKTWKDQTVFK